MTDEFDTLRAALKSAPAADPEARARALALAMANFDRLQRAGQGTADGPRPTEDRPPRTGFLNGVRSMLKSLGTRPALAATTSIAALAVGLAFLLPLDGPGLVPWPDAPAEKAPEAPVAKAEAPATASPPAATAPAADAA
ncbi:MAG: hypothetical protein IAE87_17785, partial [Rhodobacteraceae bacterium]|nr:hypothetical protein [Paracoccaceae bacterium]